jgi:hypothetical protein
MVQTRRLVGALPPIEQCRKLDDLRTGFTGRIALELDVELESARPRRGLRGGSLESLSIIR